jgi:hypothetical protein
MPRHSLARLYKAELCGRIIRKTGGAYDSSNRLFCRP